MVINFDGNNMSNSKTTMVAVDKDKNSVHAFRWATQNVDNPVVIAVHVKNKDIPHQEKNVFRPDEEDLENIFYQLRKECDPKVGKMKEAVISDSDVIRGILEYAERNHVHTIVVGASSSSTNKNYSFTMSLLLTKPASKKDKGRDIGSAIMKSAPEYSCVYVISKGGKIMAQRDATRPLISATQSHKLLALPAPSESEKGIRSQSQTIMRGEACGRSGRAFMSEMRSRSSRKDSVLESNDSSSNGSGRHRRSPFRLKSNSNTKTTKSSDDIELSSSRSMRHDSELKFASPISHSSLQTSQSRREKSEVEAEMIKLKLTLKQTMDMYNSACKQAIEAQNKAKEINKWKMEEAKRAEEIRLAEEAALAIAEQEKAKAKAAMDEAEEAMKLAEMEAVRRLEAEMVARKESEEKEIAVSALTQRDTRYRKYSIGDIEKATQKFSPSMKIGQGGYGPVFKGHFDHTPVAIKILSPDASQGRKQFNQEIEVLCSIKHPNMVLLLGACPEYGCLVYEYMDNGSLEDRLMRKQNTPPIPWPKRFEIAAEIAAALLFLHQTKPEPLVHRDLKPANILLDRNYVSKISDVGLSRLVPQSVADSVTQYYMTAAAGTLCYIDPEYQLTGMLTTKSDVYSLGIMLLQIITARPPMGLNHYVKRAIEDGKFCDILDPLVADWPIEEALAFAELALKCSELSKKDRPDLGSIVVPELYRLREFGYVTIHNQIKDRICNNNGRYTRPPTPIRNRH